MCTNHHLTIPQPNINSIGTEHQTIRSKNDVTKLLNLVRPNLIFVELCRGREEILYNESYNKSEYYAAAEYRREEQAKERQVMPYLILGDRPYHVSDLRWWEGLETVAQKVISYIVWPFIMPLRDRLWGHTILIDERDTFMAYEIHKSCAYYIEEQQQQRQQMTQTKESNNIIDSNRGSTCTRLLALKRAKQSSVTLNAYYETMCHLGDYSNNEAKEEPKQPSIVAIIGSSHLDGVCDLLKNERLWPSHIQMNLVHTERYSKSHPYTRGIVNDVEEYDRGVRVKDHSMRKSI